MHFVSFAAEIQNKKISAHLRVAL